MYKVDNNTPRIETERLILRKFNENDTNALFEILKDGEVNTFLQDLAKKAHCFIGVDELAFISVKCSSLV